MGLPNVITRTVTLYVRHAINEPANIHTNIRIPLRGVFWNDNSVNIFARTGVQVQNSVEVYIPYDKKVTGYKYVTPEEWNNTPPDELDGLWTVNLRVPPIMILGDNPFEFTPGTSAQVTTAQNNFIANNPTARTVRDVNVMDFGSPNMWHVLLRGT